MDSLIPVLTLIFGAAIGAVVAWLALHAKAHRAFDDGKAAEGFTRKSRREDWRIGEGARRSVRRIARTSPHAGNFSASASGRNRKSREGFAHAAHSRALG